MRLQRKDHEVILTGIEPGEDMTINDLVRAVVDNYKAKTNPAVHPDDEDETEITALAVQWYPHLRHDAPPSPVVIRQNVQAVAPPAAARNFASSAKVEKLQEQSRKKKEQETNVEPVFKSGFEKHIFDGDSLENSGAHTGLHSICRLKIKNGYPLIQVTNTDKNDCYAANVTYREKKASKPSSFFPDNWTEQEVMDAIRAAIRDSWANPTAYDSMKTSSVTWIGCYTGKKGTVYIGGRGSGKDTKHKVETAFPAVNKSFT